MYDLALIQKLRTYQTVLLYPPIMPPITKGELPLTLSSYFCQSKWLRC